MTLEQRLEYYKYELKEEFGLESKLLWMPDIKNSQETLKELINSDKSFIRFGDGELSIISKSGIPSQIYNEKLAEKLLEILNSDEQKLLIGMVYEWFHPSKAFRPLALNYCRTWVAKNLEGIRTFFKEGKTYYSTAISQIYASYLEYDFKAHFEGIKTLWQDKNVIVICGDKVFSNIKHNCLENAKSVQYLYGPTKNAYAEYDKLESKLKTKLKRAKKDTLLIFALGACGKILAHEMFKEGYRVLDIGHTIKDYDAYKSNLNMSVENCINFFKPDV